MVQYSNKRWVQGRIEFLNERLNEIRADINLHRKAVASFKEEKNMWGAERTLSLIESLQQDAANVMKELRNLYKHV